MTFHPRTKAGAEAPTERFAEGEQFEFRQQALPEAIRVYRSLAGSPEPALRAGALIRLARALKKTGDNETALDLYEQVAQLSGAAVDGVPADLLARWARCELLASLQRHDTLHEEARALHADLIQGRWHLDRATYELHAEDARRWTATNPTATNRDSPGGRHEPRRHRTAKPGPEDPAYDIRPPFGPFQKEMSDCVNATFARGASAVRQWPTGAP